MNNLQEQNTEMISSLTKYKTNFNIKARITNLGDLKRFDRRDGSSDHLINVDIIDLSKKETYITIFGEKAVNVANELKVGSVYIFSGLKVTTVNPKNAPFHRGNWDNYFTTDNNFSYTEVSGLDIPTVNYNFIKDFSQLSSINDGTSIDILAILHEAKDVSNIKTKAGRDLVKRDITIVDANNSSIAATLWGETAQKFNAATGSIVAIKQAKVSSFQNKKQVSISTIVANPNFQNDQSLCKLANDLRASYSPSSVVSEVSSSPSSFAARYQTTEMARNVDLNESDGVAWIDIYPWIKDPIDGNRAPFYSACQGTYNGRPCMKKREQDKPCDRCGDSSAPQPCYILRSILSDATGSIKSSCFGAKGDDIIGVSAAVLSANSYDQSGSTLNTTYIDRNMFERVAINLRISEARNQNDMGPSVNVNRVTRVPPAKIARSIISGLKQYAELE